MSKNQNQNQNSASKEPEVKELYLFDPKTGTYLGPWEVVEGIKPPESTTKEKPPFVQFDETQVFKDGKWIIFKNDALGQMQNVKERRDNLLRDSDWTQLPDAPVDKEAWAKYRQALRDVTKQESFPEVVWPEFQPTVLEAK